MGRADTPVRRILNYAQAQFCPHLPVVFVLTVVGPRGRIGSLACLPSAHWHTGMSAPLWTAAGVGLFIGDDGDCFQQAAALSVEVNFAILEEPPRKIVVWLDPEEFQSTWLGNKAIYRTRMAVADGGELVVLAPGIGTFGEDAGDRPPGAEVRLSNHARDHAVRRGDRRLARESLGGVPHDPRIVGGAIHHHLLSGQAQPRRDRIGRLSLCRVAADAGPLQSQNTPRRLERLARRRTDLLRQQSRIGTLGLSRPAAEIAELPEAAPKTDRPQFCYNPLIALTSFLPTSKRGPFDSAAHTYSPPGVQRCSDRTHGSAQPPFGSIVGGFRRRLSAAQRGEGLARLLRRQGGIVADEAASDRRAEAPCLGTNAYKQMLKGRDTFALAASQPQVYHAEHDAAYYRAQSEGAAPQMVNELLRHYKYNRYNCPLIFVAIMMNSPTIIRAAGHARSTAASTPVAASWKCRRTARPGPQFPIDATTRVGSCFRAASR